MPRHAVETTVRRLARPEDDTVPARTATIDRSHARRRLITAVATFLLVSFLVVRTSDAAFTASHVNEDNEFSTAQIDLSGDATVPLFGSGAPASVVDATNLVGGEDVAACIDITYTGSLDATDLESVQLTIDGPAAALADGLSVVVDLYDECGGSVEAAGVASGDLYDVAGDDTGWTPATDGDSRGFVFTVSVDDDDALQGESLNDVEITWSLETS